MIPLGGSCYRSTSQYEVDLIVGDQWAIEIKGTHLVQDRHLKGLRALKEEEVAMSYFVVSLDSAERLTNDGIRIQPWKVFLEKLWADQVIQQSRPV